MSLNVPSTKFNHPARKLATAVSSGQVTTLLAACLSLKWFRSAWILLTNPQHNRKQAELTYPVKAFSPKGAFCRSWVAELLWQGVRTGWLLACRGTGSVLLVPAPHPTNTPSLQAGTPAGLSKCHPGTSTPSWAGRCGRGRKCIAAANSLENVRQTPASTLAPFPQQCYFSPQAAAGLQWPGASRDTRVRKGASALSGIFLHPQPCAGLHSQTETASVHRACTPRTPHSWVCSLANSFTERHGGDGWASTKSLSCPHISLPSCISYPCWLPHALQGRYKEQNRSTLTRPSSIWLLRI